MAAKSPSSRASSTPRKNPRGGSQATPKKQTVKPQVSGGPSPLQTGWLAVASFVGQGFRAFSAQPLAKEDRRDGVPFALLLFAIVGIVVEWFNYNQTWALTLNTYTVGGALGRLSFALPIILIALAIWLFRHPSSVYSNGRVAIGLSLLLVSISGMTHLAQGRPAPGDATFAELAAGGGVLGWLVAEPFVFLAAATVYLAWPVMALLLMVSLLIMTKTPPNKIVSRSREAYAYLFGVDLEASAKAKKEPCSRARVWHAQRSRSRPG
jgi:S-DNA-T family DNA segregation ATPase FtsK/SpoIIIE